VTAADIRLKIPHEKPYHGIARLVVGGLAARLDLSYEHLDDLQLALGTVLENEGYSQSAEVTVELRVREGGVEMAIGPLHATEVLTDLEKNGDAVSLSRLLSTVVERVELEQRADGGWLHLEKRISQAG
jgi:hypothetical protein